MSPALLSLSDSQLDAIMAASRPLSPPDRVAFLEMIAQELAGHRDLGDGSVYRVVRDLQRKFFSPPDLSHSTKYR
jgi:hypothetical protein